jgi:hypothetical protein
MVVLRTWEEQPVEVQAVAAGAPVASPVNRAERAARSAGLVAPPLAPAESAVVRRPHPAELVAA